MKDRPDKESERVGWTHTHREKGKTHTHTHSFWLTWIWTCIVCHQTWCCCHFNHDNGDPPSALTNNTQAILLFHAFMENDV